jgi:hypothetical protein
MRKLTNLLVLSATLIIFSTTTIFSQVTTATLSGIVKNKKNEALSNATVNVQFAEAGIQLNLLANAAGQFTIPNLRVGGPYKISASYVNYDAGSVDSVFLELGQNNFVELILEEKAKELSGIVVTSTASQAANKKTGASTNISSRLIADLPTISRSADDYLRLTPSASPTYNGMSFAGRNGQYNNFSLDGAVFNNPFGLDAPTPGGQSNAQPISLDAIDQIQVNVAPYDLTQAGFTGAGINTVTKSGTNTTHGTVFGFFRNDALTGKKVSGTKLVVPTLSDLQAGFSLGGATKNKAHCFANFGSQQRQDEASYVALKCAGESNTTGVQSTLVCQRYFETALCMKQVLTRFVTR